MTKHRRLTRTLPLLTAATLALVLTGTALPAQAAPVQVSAFHHGNDLTLPSVPVAPHFTAPRLTSKSGAHVLGAATVPDSVDLTQYAAPVGDQGRTDSCVSWAIGHAMLGWYANKAGEPTSFAPMYIYSQTHQANTANGGGSASQDAYDVASTQGVDTASDYTQGPNNFTTLPTAAESANAAAYKISNFHELFVSDSDTAGVGSQAQTVIEQALATGSPVGLGIPIYSKFESLNSSNYTYDLNDAGATTDYKGGHYVLALGYDSQGVLIQNSWGTSWGAGGFAKIDWNFINAKAVEAEYIDGFASTIPASAPSAPTPATYLTTASNSSALAAVWMGPQDPGTTGISDYKVRVTGPGYDHTFDTGTTQHFVARSLKSYTTYKVTVTDTNKSGLSNSVSKYVKTLATYPTLKHLHGTMYRTSVHFTWSGASAVSGHITKFVLTSKYGTHAKKTYTVSAKGHSFTIKNLKRHTHYTFTFTIYNSAGKRATATMHGKTE